MIIRSFHPMELEKMLPSYLHTCEVWQQQLKLFVFKEKDRESLGGRRVGNWV